MSAAYLIMAKGLGSAGGRFANLTDFGVPGRLVKQVDEPFGKRERQRPFFVCRLEDAEPQREVLTSFFHRVTAEKRSSKGRWPKRSRSKRGSNQERDGKLEKGHEMGGQAGLFDFQSPSCDSFMRDSAARRAQSRGWTQRHRDPRRLQPRQAPSFKLTGEALACQGF
jgi:hypothetical protein